MTTTVSDIIVTPARCYLAPAGTAKPDESTVDLGEQWAGDWLDLGPTLTPVTLAYSREEKDVKVEQYTGTVARFVVDEGYVIETTLAQLTPSTLAKALNGTNVPTPAGASQRAFDQLKAGGNFTLERYIFGVEGRYRNNANVEFPVRAFLPICTIKLNGNLQFAKADVAGIALQASAMTDTTAPEGEQLYEMHRVTALGTTE